MRSIVSLHQNSHTIHALYTSQTSSDVIGRRGLILLGLSSLAIFNLIGAFTSDYWVSLTMHGLAGLLDSTSSVAYAAVGDLTTGRQRQSVSGGVRDNAERRATPVLASEDFLFFFFWVGGERGL